jgi:sugar lactone lactonase YvrE
MKRIKNTRLRISKILSFVLLQTVTLVLLASVNCVRSGKNYGVFEKAGTFSGIPKGDEGAILKEPFGLAFGPDGGLFISDGEAGKIWRADKTGALSVVTVKVNTPSAMTFDKNGNLYVADSGSHTIKKIDIAKDEVSIAAGVENKSGYADGDAGTALFNAPIGIAIDENDRIYVADTYNDRIRMIENGKVSTLAGSAQGFADSDNAPQAKFDTPCGLAVTKDGGLLVADTGNKRIRLIDKSGKVSTIAGGGDKFTTFSTPLETAFSEPVDVKVDSRGVIFIADAAENTVYALGRGILPLVEKLTPGKRGLADGDLNSARFNRPSGIAFDGDGNIFIADSENQLVRVLQNRDGKTGGEISEIKAEEINRLELTANAFREAAPPRWPYDPPSRAREVAGTLGEVRGEIKENEDAWFHNGLDVVGGYGETARFVRSEKVLRPVSTQLFDTLRENLRMPTMGYIHIRLGRNQNSRPFSDPRFLFSTDQAGKMNGVRIRRGTKFEAGEPIGTLNPMNHVHLIAGRSGDEMNALAALALPGVSDSIVPVIEGVNLYGENWSALGETRKENERINLSGKVRIVVKAYDRMDGNAKRRRLGVFRLGYQILNDNGSPAAGFERPLNTIIFDKLPDDGNRAVKFVYGVGSKSGATGETIFNYIVTDEVGSGAAKEGFFDTGKFSPGNYILRVFAADFFGNQASKDIKIAIGG